MHYSGTGGMNGAFTALEPLKPNIRRFIRWYYLSKPDKIRENIKNPGVLNEIDLQ
jgi:hypothetical protein